MGYFSELTAFSLEKAREFSKTLFVKITDFCEFFMSFFQENTGNSEKHPVVANPLANRPLFGFAMFPAVNTLHVKQ